MEENIKTNGCQDSLKAWNGTIVDGHNRYKICNENNITFEITEMHFEDRDAAIVWIIKNQFGRRNLLPFQRSELALKMKGIIKEKAKANQSDAGGDRKSLLQKSEKAVSPIHTDEELSKMAGVSRFTIRQAETILKSGTLEQQERARSGGKGNTVNAIFNEVVTKGETERKCSKCGLVLPIERFDGKRPTCKTCMEKSKGSARADMNLISSTIEDVRNYTPREYTAYDLAEELGALCGDFTRKFKTSLTIHSTVLDSDAGKEKAIAALSQAETAISELRRLIIHE